MTYRSHWHLALVRPSTGSTMTVPWTFEVDTGVPDDAAHVRWLISNQIEAFMRDNYSDWKVQSRYPRVPV